MPRGAGTGLSGGTLPIAAPVMICTSRMQAIESIDVRNRRVVAQAGVVNLWISRRVQRDGLHYAPDPSSQTACTIGGNVAENSGGPHTLKYGVTTNHVLGVELVLPDGESCSSAAPSRTARATTSPGSWSGPRARSASSPRATCA